MLSSALHHRFHQLLHMNDAGRRPIRLVIFFKCEITATSHCEVQYRTLQIVFVVEKKQRHHGTASCS